jgi:predicted MPP superfamily phosphohydrolase
MDRRKFIRTGLLGSAALVASYPFMIERYLVQVNNKRYSAGVIDTPNCKLFISRGIGWAVAPVRFNCPPEIAVLELYRST